MKPHQLPILPLLFLPALLLVLGGCSRYSLRGVVVKSDTSSIQAGHWDQKPDSLPGPPLAGANIEVIFEPRTTRPRKLGNLATDDQGRFQLPVSEVGAGWMEYEVMVIVRQPGYRSSWRILRLPAQEQWIIIQMAPGRDEGGPPTDMLEESLRLRRMLEGD